MEQQVKLYRSQPVMENVFVSVTHRRDVYVDSDRDRKSKVIVAHCRANRKRPAGRQKATSVSSYSSATTAEAGVRVNILSHTHIVGLCMGVCVCTVRTVGRITDDESKNLKVRMT